MEPMNWTMVGALGELGGAIAVVASLLYVGHQVRQNNRISRAEAYREGTLCWARMLHRWADDPPSANAFMNSSSGVRLADLPESTRNTYLLRHSAMIRVLETIYRQVKEGVMTADALEMLPSRATPIFRDAWERVGGSYSPDFRAFVEERYSLTRSEAATRGT
jgi:hypothetical protein